MPSSPYNYLNPSWDFYRSIENRDRQEKIYTAISRLSKIRAAKAYEEVKRSHRKEARIATGS